MIYRRRVVMVLAILVAMTAVVPARAAKRSVGLDTRAADTVATRAHDANIRKAVEAWAKNASLADLVWVLRRPGRELGATEPLLVNAALKRCPTDRVALRRRLSARLLAPQGSGSKRAPEAPAPAAPVARPAASVFRVGVLLPDSGDYKDYATEIWTGLEAGLASIPPGAHRPELEFWPTGDQNPARAASAIEWATQRCGILVGELLSTQTLAVATAARLLELPLVSPTATDEAIGTIGPSIFQIGPSGWSRGERLARVMVDKPGLKVGVLTSMPVESDAFAGGFAATAESLGATVAWRSSYPSGTVFREEVRTLGLRGLDVLLWDGESREAESLVRELTRQRVSVRLCGGEGLAPERIHAELRPLLEGVRYVGDEWRLAPEQQAALDSVVRARSQSRPSPLHVRGWLAGRAIGSAVASGALSPEEIATALTARCGAPPWLAPHRFLDVAREGAMLPMYAVQRGKASPYQP